MERLALVVPHDEDAVVRPADPQLRKAAAKFREFMQALELDLDDPNLVGTEWRVARAYRELFAGHYAAAEPTLRTFPNSEGYAASVVVEGIPFHSICAHHFLPFSGTADVSYVPRDRVVGLSKLARVVEFFARRPQLQERMTEQIAGLIDERLQPSGVKVVLRARHLCMELRGVQKAGATTTTTATRGSFGAQDGVLRTRQ